MIPFTLLGVSNLWIEKVTPTLLNVLHGEREKLFCVKNSIAANENCTPVNCLEFSFLAYFNISTRFLVILFSLSSNLHVLFLSKFSFFYFCLI